MGEDFVLNYGSVVVDKDVFDSESRDFGQKDAAEGVGEGGVDTNK